MGRYTGPKCKRCRREGVKLYLKGARCYSPKCPIEKQHTAPPGQHGGKRRRRLSNYGVQLREKQKVKRIYGLREAQFHKLYEEASESKTNTGLRLLQLLETRLDNVVFRAGFSLSRSIARQLVTHGHILVNGKRASVPSHQVKPGDVVSLGAKTADMQPVKEAMEEKPTTAKWLKVKAGVAKVERLPEREEVEADINESLIVEFYSR